MEWNSKTETFDLAIDVPRFTTTRVAESPSSEYDWLLKYQVISFLADCAIVVKVQSQVRGYHIATPSSISIETDEMRRKQLI